MVNAQMNNTEDARRQLEELYTRYRLPMQRAAESILHDVHLAEDVLQESFLRIARNLHKIDRPDSPATRSFVMTIARNAALSMYARLQKQRPEEWLPEELAAEDDTEADVLAELDLQLVLSIIQNLPSGYRDPLLLYYVEELSMAEVARRLELKQETVKKRIQRGRRMVLDGIAP